MLLVTGAEVSASMLVYHINTLQFIRLCSYSKLTLKHHRVFEITSLTQDELENILYYSDKD